MKDKTKQFKELLELELANPELELAFSYLF